MGAYHSERFGTSVNWNRVVGVVVVDEAGCAGLPCRHGYAWVCTACGGRCSTRDAVAEDRGALDAAGLAAAAGREAGWPPWNTWVLAATSPAMERASMAATVKGTFLFIFSDPRHFARAALFVRRGRYAAGRGG